MAALLLLQASGPCASKGRCGSSYLPRRCEINTLSPLKASKVKMRQAHLSPLNRFVGSLAESEVNLREGRSNKILMMHMLWRLDSQENEEDKTK